MENTIATRFFVDGSEVHRLHVTLGAAVMARASRLQHDPVKCSGWSFPTQTQPPNDIPGSAHARTHRDITPAQALYPTST